jgi:hypothetical protein
VGHPSLASEFPNDNAAISSGTIWIHPDLTGPAVAELAPFEPVPSESFVLYFDDDVFVDSPVELDASGPAPAIAVALAQPEPDDAAQLSELDSDADNTSPATPPDSAAFSHFERALTSALLAQGSTRSAALVARLLRLEPLAADGVPKDVLLTLQSRGYLDGNARYSPKYRELCGAWTALLQGSSEDFSACGTTTLDRFGADLLAALLAVPTTRADELRRALRKAGVAAFGVLEAA